MTDSKDSDFFEACLSAELLVGNCGLKSWKEVKDISCCWIASCRLYLSIDSSCSDMRGVLRVLYSVWIWLG